MVSPSLGALLVWVAGFSMPLAAQQMQPMMTNAPAAAQPPVAATKSIPPAKNPPPGVPPNTLGQYGNILAPGDQVEHPLKLRIPGPGVGEVKIPSMDELTMRDKLEQLAGLSDADIAGKLAKWPPYGKMSLRDQGMMLQRIQDFRDYRSNTAKGKAHDMGLLTLTPEQEAKFEKEYWDKRLQMDRALAKQFAPVYQAQVQKLQDDLYREFSAVSQGPVAQAPKPPAPKPAATAATNSPAMPIAQAPK
jgi:hypothetical protein